MLNIQAPNIKIAIIRATFIFIKLSSFNLFRKKSDIITKDTEIWINEPISFRAITIADIKNINIDDIKTEKPIFLDFLSKSSSKTIVKKKNSINFNVSINTIPAPSLKAENL